MFETPGSNTSTTTRRNHTRLLYGDQDETILDQRLDFAIASTIVQVGLILEGIRGKRMISRIGFAKAMNLYLNEGVSFFVTPTIKPEFEVLVESFVGQYFCFPGWEDAYGQMCGNSTPVAFAGDWLPGARAAKKAEQTQEMGRLKGLVNSLEQRVAELQKQANSKEARAASLPPTAPVNTADAGNHNNSRGGSKSKDQNNNYNENSYNSGGQRRQRY